MATSKQTADEIKAHRDAAHRADRDAHWLSSPVDTPSSHTHRGNLADMTNVPNVDTTAGDAFRGDPNR